MTAPQTGTPWLYCIKGAKVSRRTPNSAEKSTVFIDMVDLYALKFENEKSTKKAIGADCARLGKTDAISSRITASMATFTVSRKNVEAFRAALSGETTELTRASTPVTSQAIDFLGAGVWVKFASHKVSGITIPTSTEGVDYEVDYQAGLVRALAGGGLIDTTTTIDYNLDAEVGTMQAIGNLAEIEWALQIPLGADQFEGGVDAPFVEIDAASIDLDGAFEFTIENPEDQDEKVLAFTCELRTLPGETEPARIYGMPDLVHDWL